MKGFYFATTDRRLRYADGRVITVGETHTVAGEIKLCANGLHASLTPFDALQYAPGPILYLVRLSGTIVQGDAKCAASERTYLVEFDAEELLRRYARWCALRHIELIRPYCSESVYALIVEYLMTGNETLRVAARAAAGAAVEAAARAAGAAVEAAARAAGAAAEAAAWGARAAARAAWAAAEAAAEAAARAARAAAWAAERKALAAEFDRMITEATGWEV